MDVLITFCKDIYNTESFEVVETNDVLACLQEHYGKWPQNARLYLGSVSDSTDITPTCDLDIAAIRDMPGPFYVVEYPGFGIDTLLYIAIAATVVAAFVLKPKIPNSSQRSTASSSPNNELAQRTNSARPNARVPDIFGQVRSTPDLLSVPYSTYVDGKEVENSLLCIGVGQYEIQDSKDGTTRASQIQGTSVQVWKPNTDILVDPPYYSVGAGITDEVLYLRRNDAVNGQALIPPFLIAPVRAIGNDNIAFQAPNKVQGGGSAGIIIWFASFKEDEQVTIFNSEVRDPALQILGETASLDMDEQYAFRVLAPAGLPTWINIGDQVGLAPAVLAFTYYDGVGIATQEINLTGIYDVEDITLVMVPNEGTGLDEQWALIKLFEPQEVNQLWDWQTSIRDRFTGAVIPPLGVVSTTDVAIDVNGDAVLYDFNGVYDIAPGGVSNITLTLLNPELVNPSWATMPSLTPNTSAILTQGETAQDDYIIGPFSTDVCTDILLNLVALQGHYADDGENVRGLTTEFRFDITPVDANDDPTGATATYPLILNTAGAPKATLKDSKGVTLKLTGLPSSRYSILAYRVSPSHTIVITEGNVSEEVKWKDMYFGTTATNTNFGNFTVIRARTIATDGALSLKERKLNLLVTRQIPIRVSGSTFTSTLYSTKRSDEILSFVAMDSKLGARPVDEIDFTNIYKTIAKAQDYFGFANPIEFCYTFDEEMTFEEMWSAIAQAVFCVAYRQGSLLRIKLEGRTDDSVLLFNHRNKIPGTETRTVTWGPTDNFDGVAFTYVSPVDDAILTKYIPEDRTARNEKKVESIGIRNEQQAHIAAWRYYQKLLYQNVTTKFDATEEAELLVNSDRILVADNTRPDTQDGEVLDYQGLTVATSQKVVFDPSKTYSIFLQLYDGSVQALGCTPIPGDEYALTLSAPPRYPLIFADDRYAKTGYVIVAQDDPRQSAFLLSERETGESGTSTVTAVNYDARYYAHDNDYFPSVDRNIYASSELFGAEYAPDAMAVSPGMALIRPSPVGSDSTALEPTFVLESIVFTTYVPAIITDATAIDPTFALESISFTLAPLLSTKDAMDVAITNFAIELPNLIASEPKDAMDLSLNLTIALA